MFNQKLTESVALLAVLNPASFNAGASTTGWIDFSKYRGLLALILVGAITGSGTIDAKFQQATDSAGAGAKDVTAKAITQLTGAGSDSNKQVQINLRPEHLDFTNKFRYVRLSVTNAVAAALQAAVVLGMDPAFNVTDTDDVATVDETV